MKPYLMVRRRSGWSGPPLYRLVLTMLGETAVLLGLFVGLPLAIVFLAAAMGKLP